MNKLVEEIIKPLLEANPQIKKVVGIYGGRFQPFGPHHYKTYKWLQSKVDEAYITTSNIKKPPRHPMNFKEKVRHMTKMGVKSNRIIEEKSPYVAKNLAKKFDEKTTAFVYVFGAKDAGRLGGGGKYFQDYKKSKGNIKGFGENGYYLVAPHVSISVGGKEVSGTTMRELLGSDKYDDKERAKLFKKMFGYFNQGVFNMMVNKFKKLFEDVDMEFKPISMHYTPSNKKKLKPKFKDGKNKELLKGQMKENVSSGQLAQVEKYLDKLWGKVGIDVEFTRHFLDRVNDKRNDKPISSAEVIKIFRQTYKKYGKQIAKLGKNAQAVMKDMKTDVNVPFVLKWDGKEFDMIAKTIMRKKNFKSSNKKFAVEGWLEKGNKKDKALKLKISKLYTKAFKHMPGSPNQEKIKKEIEKLRNQLSEGVDLPIKIGDTVRMGKFKNKKVVIKTIDWNEKGDLLINGRPALKFRIEKSKEIDEFLIHNDMRKILESSNTGVDGIQGVDSGPSLMFKNSEHYKGRGNQEAEKLGWTVINYILQGDTDNLPPSEFELLDGWPFGPHNSVTYLPAGIGTGVTPNNQENLTGTKGYDKWFRAMSTVATEVGIQLMKFSKKDKDIRKQIAKDTVDTIKQQEKEEIEEGVFTEAWWKEQLLFEEDIMDKTIKFKTKDGEEKEATVGGILKQGEDHPGYKKAKSMTDKSDDKKPVKMTKIDTNPFDDKEEPKEKLKSKKDNSWMKEKDGWEILDSENVEVAKTKSYSDEQAREETGEYFENERTLKAVPNLAKDEDELTQKILDASEETFSSEELQNINNSDAGEILDASEEGGIDGMKKKGKELATKYKKGWDYITNNIESGEPQEAPIVLRDKKGNLHLMAGNTRLMSNTAYGRKIPLKVIEYDGEFQYKNEESFSKEWWKDLLTEGGAYGHMAHPFDDKDLTFGDLKKIIELGLGGQLSREDNVTEKLDGQNIMISWKDGKLIAARNKGHIKNRGKTALTTKGIASKFAGRGDIADAFNFAMKDLEKAIKGLSQKQKDKIFDNGYNFMNMEVMWPKSANVIDYDKAELVFHGALKYDDSGKVVGEVSGSGKILAGMIKQVNMHIGKKYKIGKPVFLEVPKHQDFGKMKGKFLGRLSKLQSKFGLKNNDTLALYHQKWWEQFITKQLKKISPKVLEGLVKRWAFFDKSYKIPVIKQDLKNEPIFLEWVLKTDKENHAKIVKENMKPFETLFFEVGAEILKNVQGFMAANPDKAVQGIRKKLDKAISDVRGGGDLKKLNTLRLQLDKLNAIGGTKAIVPSEGIVFKYKGKTYKFTGAFAPINQIAGLINF